MSKPRKPLRIVFMGTPDFAVPSLKAIIDAGFDVAGVVTAPDKAAGRGMKLSESPVKKFAAENGLHILQPTNLKSEVFQQELRALQANLQVVIAFRMLPVAVWNMPEYGTLNLHASLLPKYRGAAPINWAIINGEKETGLTTFLLKHEIDTGDMLVQSKEPIWPTDTAGTLHDRLMIKGAGVVVETLKQIQAGTETPQPQDTASASHAPKIFTETCQIDFNKPCHQVVDQIRGLSPYPAAWMMINDKRCKVFSAKANEDAQTDGAIGALSTDHKSYLRVQAIGGSVDLLELQLEGKKRIGVDEFLRGFKV